MPIDWTTYSQELDRRIRKTLLALGAEEAPVFFPSRKDLFYEIKGIGGDGGLLAFVDYGIDKNGKWTGEGDAPSAYFTGEEGRHGWVINVLKRNGWEGDRQDAVAWREYKPNPTGNLDRDEKALIRFFVDATNDLKRSLRTHPSYKRVARRYADRS